MFKEILKHNLKLVILYENLLHFCCKVYTTYMCLYQCQYKLFRRIFACIQHLFNTAFAHYLYKLSAAAYNSILLQNFHSYKISEAEKSRPLKFLHQSQYLNLTLKTFLKHVLCLTCTSLASFQLPYELYNCSQLLSKSRV